MAQEPSSRRLRAKRPTTIVVTGERGGAGRRGGIGTGSGAMNNGGGNGSGHYDEAEMGPFQLAGVGSAGALHGSAPIARSPFVDLESPFVSSELLDLRGPRDEEGHDREGEDEARPWSPRNAPSPFDAVNGELSEVEHEDEDRAGAAPTPAAPFILLPVSVLATTQAFLAGSRDESALTDAAFLAAHPERRSAKIAPGETAAAAEWQWMRAHFVAPFLRSMAASSPSARASNACTPQAIAKMRERVARASAGDLSALTEAERKAVLITSTFETGWPGGFGGLTGDFDAMGLSFGLMNWNFGAGSFVPLLRDFARDFPDRFTAAFGPGAATFRDVVFATEHERQMAFVRGTMNDGHKHIQEPWATYFGRLEVDPEFRKIEVREAKKGLDRAELSCTRLGLKSERALALLFDVVSQQGPYWPTVKDRQRLLDERLAAMQNRTERDVMEAIVDVVTETTPPKWREDVRVRKTCFVVGSGRVHGDCYDLGAMFGLGDGPFAAGATPAIAHEEELELEVDPAPHATP